MYRLSAETLLQAWETGLALHPVDQALLLLAAAEPTADLTDLSRLSIGQRGLAEIGVLQFCHAGDGGLWLYAGGHCLGAFTGDV